MGGDECEEDWVLVGGGGWARRGWVEVVVERWGRGIGWVFGWGGAEVERGRVEGGGDTRDDDGNDGGGRGRETGEREAWVERQRGDDVAGESVGVEVAACGMEQGRCGVLDGGRWE